MSPTSASAHCFVGFRLNPVSGEGCVLMKAGETDDSAHAVWCSLSMVISTPKNPIELGMHRAIGDFAGSTKRDL